MQQYIDNGRSTPGAAQKNGTTVSLDGKAKGKQAKKKNKKATESQSIP